MPPKCVRKSTISELQATSRGIFIVGIIIRKQNYYATTPGTLFLLNNYTKSPIINNNNKKYKC